MPGKWDSGFKKLFASNPQEAVDWLVPGAKFVRTKPLNLNNREIEVDLLYDLLLNEQACLLHTEFQTYGDEIMAMRMWEYNALATSAYKVPVYSVLIYLRKTRKVAKPYYTWTFPNG
ncbi:MAG: hypothetical protein M3Z24_07660, partial [Chloroflexota bacterium]|nr:hypothetical protein [Chloroflexota bacterium]